MPKGQESPVKADKSSRTTKLWITLVVLIIGIAVPLIILDVIGSSALRRQTKALRDAGEPMTLAEIEARRNTVPDELNSALILSSLSNELNELNNLPKENLPIFGGVELPPWGDPYAADMAQAADGFLKQHSTVLARLEAIADLPYGRFPLDVNADPIDILLPQLAPTRAAGKFLSLAALNAAFGGHAELSGRRCQAAANVAGSVTNEPTIISALVFFAIDALAIDTLERVLAMVVLDDDALESLGDTFRAHEGLQNMAFALRGEIIVQQAMLSDPVRAASLNAGGPVGPAPALTGGLYKVLGGWLKTEQAKSIELLRTLLAKVDSPRQLLKAGIAFDAQIVALPRYYVLSRTIMTSLSRAVLLSVLHKARLRCVQAALASERFRIATGGWPAQLADLVPDYLDAVPLDPFDDQPLRYLILPDRITIYSIGEDGLDNGGDLVGDPKLKIRPPDLGFRLLNPDGRRVGINPPAP